MSMHKVSSLLAIVILHPDVANSAQRLEFLGSS